MFPGLDLYCKDPAQHLATAGQDPDDLDRDMNEVCDIPGTPYSAHNLVLSHTTLHCTFPPRNTANDGKSNWFMFL